MLSDSTYKLYKPHPALQPFIDAYWRLESNVIHPEALTLMPGAGVTLLVNLGETIRSTRFEKWIEEGGIFLVGPMMQTDVQILYGKVLLIGINFKPGAFMHFYRYDCLDRITDQFIHFNRKDFPDLTKTILHFVPYLDQFYLDRLSVPRTSIVAIASDISRRRGIAKIDSLARGYFTTARQLEREFRKQLGLSPKEFINLERFNHAFEKVQTRADQSLLDIAWDCGYYDHAHMTNDFKRYTGKAPTDFILSDFSKTIATESG